jgi:hypothetical protein
MLCIDAGASLRRCGMELLRRPLPGAAGLLGSTDTLTVLAQDIRNVENFMGWTLPEIVRMASQALFLALVLCALDWRLTFGLGLMACLAAPAYRWAQGRYAAFTRKHRELRAGMDRRVIEHVAGMEVIRAFNLTGARQELLSRAVRDYRDVNDAILREVVPAYGVFSLLVQLVAASTMALAAWLAESGPLDGVTLASGLIVALRATQCLDEAAKRLEIVPVVAESLGRVQREWRKPPDGPPATRLSSSFPGDMTLMSARQASGSREASASGSPWPGRSSPVEDFVIELLPAITVGGEDMPISLPLVSQRLRECWFQFFLGTMPQKRMPAVTEGCRASSHGSGALSQCRLFKAPGRRSTWRASRAEVQFSARTEMRPEGSPSLKRKSRAYSQALILMANSGHRCPWKSTTRFTVMFTSIFPSSLLKLMSSASLSTRNPSTHCPS